MLAGVFGQKAIYLIHVESVSLKILATVDLWDKHVEIEVVIKVLANCID